MSVVSGSLSQFRAGRSGFFGDDFQIKPGLNNGTYGDATHVAQLTVDGSGNLTNITSVSITGAPPSGAAGGALTGTYPNPQLAVQTQALDMGVHQIKGVSAGTAATDAVNLTQLNSATSVKASVAFITNSLSLTDNTTCQYSNAGSGNITQTLGVISIANSTANSQAYLVIFNMYGVSPGNSVAVYLTDSTGVNIWGASDTGVTSVNSQHHIASSILIAAGTSATVKAVCRISGGGTFTLSYSAQGGVSVNNSCTVTQIY